jgi:hypothetical protein
MLFVKIRRYRLSAPQNVTRDISSSLSEFDAPFLVLHGKEDRVTDPKLSQALYDESKSKDKTIKLYDGKCGLSFLVTLILLRRTQARCLVAAALPQLNSLFSKSMLCDEQACGIRCLMENRLKILSW